jgi:pyridoxal phosphate enzyme (YggS family)
MRYINSCKVICASKYFNDKEMNILYDKGVRFFGENRVDELIEKKEKIRKKDIEWHFIGHLQRNKAKKIINEIDVLHTVDSLKLLQEIQKHRNNTLDCLIQINLTNEKQKNGILIDEFPSFFNQAKKYDKINIIGLMTIGKNKDLETTRKIFSRLKSISKKYNLNELSMGMTEDFEIAIQEGSTMIRLGSYFKKLLKE